MITKVIPSQTFSSFEKRAYFTRAARHANDNGFDDMLKRTIRMSKPACSGSLI